MKRKGFLLLMVLLVCLAGCSKKVEDSGLKWDCSTVVPSEDPTYIVYPEVEIQTDSGKISFQNRNAFSIRVYLYGDGKLVSEHEMTPGSALVIFQISSTTVYTVGLYADQPAGTEIRVMAYDGNTSQEYYVIPEYTVSE